MTDWNYADVWETVAACRPDDVALVHGDAEWTWATFDRRAGALATALRSEGLGRHAHVTQYLLNGPAYLESMYACFKAAFVPVNTNVRYGPEELTHLWTLADVDAVVFHGRFTNTAAAVRPRVPRVSTWIHVDDGTEDCPAWALPYETLTIGPGDERAPYRRSGDDPILLFTGGTTGLPKGVIWRQDDILARMNAGALVRYPEDGGLDDVRRVQARQRGPVHLPASPLMHGTAAITATSTLTQGGTVVTLPSPSFDAVELLEAVERNRVVTMAIVGNMFARPIVEALDRWPDRFDISSLRQVLSSGVGWSIDLQARLLDRNPKLVVIDAFGSSEAIGLGRAVRRSGRVGEASVFEMPETTRVIDDEGRDVAPGSGTVGRVAARGRIPLGYYADPEATARTFVVIDGERHAIPGDLARVNADGSMVLLGRGSQCINTGGEKVFVEEVEDVIRTHPAVLDAAVVGVPDARWGQSVCAVVQLAEGATLTLEALRHHVKGRLAGYKAPRRIVVVDSTLRGMNGKFDYPALTELATTATRAGDQ